MVASGRQWRLGVMETSGEPAFSLLTYVRKLRVAAVPRSP